jgi:hypothetical protein
MGTSKSALAASLLADTVEAMRAALFQFPDPLDRLSADDKVRLAQMLAGMVDDAVTGAVADIAGGSRA